MKFWKQVGFNAILGIIAGGIVDLIDMLIKRRKQWVGNILCDPEHLKDVKSIYFDFDRYVMTDTNTGEILVDFSMAKYPRKEMIKVLNLIN